MKYKLFICLLVLTALLFTSCKSDPDYLSYQKYPMTVKGLLTVDGFGCDITVTMKKKDKASITVNSPEKFKDYRFSVDREGIWIYYDDIEVPLSEDMLSKGIYKLTDMFSIDPLTLSEIGTQKIGRDEHLRLVYPCNTDSSVVVYLKEEGDKPTLIETSDEETGILFAVESIEYPES
ncbi:MAG: hypothetical protein E7652_00885 [Ruminococcaceae bacterium]|nr:hypothetical protein [Oscillospiraceae bacterium]